MPVLTLPRTDALSVRAKALVFEDAASRALLARIQQVAPSDASVLLCGETGTGKEIVARHVHALSSRSAQPFVAVNCGALVESLIESELFGHERGAFTGALQTKIGWFEAARGGTLFLDEIGDLPLGAQVKLLRVLQESEVVRLGSRTPIAVDVRLIAATNVELEEAVNAGRFREDLYYRLNVAPLTVLPLRERPADVLPIAHHFIESYGKRLGLTVLPSLSREATHALLAYSWPGNIRELENVVHHALLISRSNVLGPEELRLDARTRPRSRVASVAPQVDDLDAALNRLFEADVPSLFSHVEERLVRAAYRFSDRNQVHTARLLGISRNVLRARLIELGEITAAPRKPKPDASLPTHGFMQRTAASVLRVGYQRFGLLPLLRATGMLERALESHGVRVEWREFEAGMHLVERMESDALHLGLVGEAPPVFAQAARIPIVYLAAEAPAPEHEAIVVQAHSSINSIRELKGRTVLLSRGSNVHYFLIRALEAAQLTYDDIRVAYAAPDRAQTMFENSVADAWATWEPFLGKVQREAGARLLRDARGLTANTSYYIAARSFSEEHPELVAIFLDQVSAVAHWAQSHGEAALTLLASALGAPRAVAAGALVQMRAPRPFGAEHIAAQQTIADTFHRLKLIASPVQVSQSRWQAAPQLGLSPA